MSKRKPDEPTTPDGKSTKKQKKSETLFGSSLMEAPHMIISGIPLVIQASQLPTPPGSHEKANQTIAKKITPTLFPESTCPDSHLFGRNTSLYGLVSKDTMRLLYELGCVEVDNLPQMSLKNRIHKVFRLDAFEGMTPAEYERIGPALTLASRFLTDTTMLEYWNILCTGHVEAVLESNLRTKQQTKSSQEVPNVLSRDSTKSEDEIAAEVQSVFDNVASYTKFKTIDREWAQSSVDFKAETFVNESWYGCRYRNDMLKGKCRRHFQCETEDNGACRICGSRRWNKFHKKTAEKAMRRQYEQLGGTDAACARPGTIRSYIEKQLKVSYDNLCGTYRGYRMTNDQLSQMFVALHPDVSDHIGRANSDSSWTQSEEARFQFSLAIVLVHELVHVFWQWARRRCWHCHNEVYAAPDDMQKLLSLGPELGHAWEYWALGMRMPEAGPANDADAQKTSTVFQRCLWLFTHTTVDCGSGTKHYVMDNNFILTMAYISDWFQESTWESIAQSGRIQGRPSIRNLPVLRDMHLTPWQEGKINFYECTVMQYDLGHVHDRGGWETTNRESRDYLYGDFQYEEHCADWLRTQEHKVRELNAQLEIQSRPGKLTS